jgi:hypothetical protein
MNRLIKAAGKIPVEMVHLNSKAIVMYQEGLLDDEGMFFCGLHFQACKECRSLAGVDLDSLRKSRFDIPTLMVNGGVIRTNRKADKAIANPPPRARKTFRVSGSSDALVIERVK